MTQTEVILSNSKNMVTDKSSKKRYPIENNEILNKYKKIIKLKNKYIFTVPKIEDDNTENEMPKIEMKNDIKFEKYIQKSTLDTLKSINLSNINRPDENCNFEMLKSEEEINRIKSKLEHQKNIIETKKEIVEKRRLKKFQKKSNKKQKSYKKQVNKSKNAKNNKNSKNSKSAKNSHNKNRKPKVKSKRPGKVQRKKQSNKKR